MRGGEYWSIDYFVENQLYIYSLLNDFGSRPQTMGSSILSAFSINSLHELQNSKSINYNVSIQAIITSLSSLTNGKFFIGINMFLAPICVHGH